MWHKCFFKSLVHEIVITWQLANEQKHTHTHKWAKSCLDGKGQKASKCLFEMHLSYLPRSFVHRIVFSFSKTLLMKSFCILEKESFLFVYPLLSNHPSSRTPYRYFLQTSFYLLLPTPLCYKHRIHICTYRRYNRTSMWCRKFAEAIRRSILQAIMGKKLYATPIHVMMMPLTFRMTFFSHACKHTIHTVLGTSCILRICAYEHSIYSFPCLLGCFFVVGPSDRRTPSSHRCGEISNIPSFIWELTYAQATKMACHHRGATWWNTRPIHRIWMEEKKRRKPMSWNKS